MRKFTKLFLVSLFLFILLYSIPSSSFSMLEENWPTYMGNDFLTGNNDGIPPQNFNLIWSFSKGSILYNPVPVNGRIYIVSTDKHLYCLDQKTGKLIWSFKADAPLTRMVIVYEGKVILPGGRFIYCLDENNGKLIWARRDETFGFYGTPTAAEGRLFYGNRKGFYARDINTGKLIWENDSIYTYGGFPVYWNGIIYTISKNYNENTAFLFALKETDGTVLWKVPIPNYSNIFSPVIYNKKLFLNAGFSCYIYNAKTGNLTKEIRFKKPVFSNPVFSQDSVYFSLADGEIIELNSDNFSYRKIYKAPIGTQFSIVGSNLYIPEKGILNDIAIVDASSGKLIRKVSIPEGQPFTFTIANGKLFVPAGRKLYAIGEKGIEIASNNIIASQNMKNDLLANKNLSEGTGEKIKGKLKAKNTENIPRPSKKSGRLQTATIHGKVYDKETKKPIPSGNITATTKLKSGNVIVNEEKISNGEFNIEIPKKGKTDLLISSPGHLFKDIVLPDEKAINDLSTESLDISLPKVKKNSRIRIESIYFSTGSANLTKESLPTLNNLLKIMKENPRIKIEIDGHTDSTGSSDFNMKLSLKRANAIKYWLIMNGINENRITTKGFGDKKPVADNSTPEGRRKNRRVEIIIKND